LNRVKDNYTEGKLFKKIFGKKSQRERQLATVYKEIGLDPEI
jgi:hypothetical protein